MSAQAPRAPRATPPNESRPRVASRPRIESRVESICQAGCRQVRQAIAALERGANLPETRDLDADERAALLAELKSIMAVYGDACPIG